MTVLMIHKPPIPLAADERWQHMIGQHGDLVAIAARWPTTTATPPGVLQILNMARELFAHSYFVYEFATVAVMWSLLAVEAALRARLNAKPDTSFAKLIDRALEAGVLSGLRHDQLNAGRKLRNEWMHATVHPVLSPGMAEEMLRASHELIALMFPESLPDVAGHIERAVQMLQQSTEQ